MKYDDINFANANSTDEIKQSLTANDSSISIAKVKELIKQAKQLGFAAGFKEAKAIYCIDAKALEDYTRKI